MTYSAPRITDLGSVRSLTQQGFDKIGSGGDAIFPSGSPLDGSIVPDPA